MYLGIRFVSEYNTTQNSNVMTFMIILSLWRCTAKLSLNMNDKTLWCVFSVWYLFYSKSHFYNDCGAAYINFKIYLVWSTVQMFVTTNIFCLDIFYNLVKRGKNSFFPRLTVLLAQWNALTGSWAFRSREPSPQNVVADGSYHQIST